MSQFFLEVAIYYENNNKRPISTHVYILKLLSKFYSGFNIQNFSASYVKLQFLKNRNIFCFQKFLEWMSWKATLLGLSKALRSVSSARGGNPGCKCTASMWTKSQELVILWVTLPSGRDTSPDWGHELVLDLLPGVLFEVCLDGSRLRNLPLQFCAMQNKSHECRGANWRKPTLSSTGDFPYPTTTTRPGPSSPSSSLPRSKLLPHLPVPAKPSFPSP